MDWLCYTLGRLAIHCWQQPPARSTDVKGLATILCFHDVWQQNIDHIKAIAAEADIPSVLGRSGKSAAMGTILQTVLRVLARNRHRPVMSGLTKDLDIQSIPMFGYDTELRPMTTTVKECASEYRAII